MTDRILTIIKLKNLTPSQFADEIGVQRSGISHLISGRNKPSLEFVLKILNRFPDIDPTWLLFGIKKPDLETTSFITTEASVVKSITEPQPEKKNKISQELERVEKTESLIEKIVILYKDNSFKEYNPKKIS